MYKALDLASLGSIEQVPRRLNIYQSEFIKVGVLGAIRGGKVIYLANPGKVIENIDWIPYIRNPAFHSKIFQLLLLLALSLPMLGVLRVFGGVPWDFIVASVCVTFTSILVVASITMFFSICFRQAFVTILMSFGTLVVIYLVLPTIGALMVAASGAYRDE